MRMRILFLKMVLANRRFTQANKGVCILCHDVSARLLGLFHLLMSLTSKLVWRRMNTPHFSLKLEVASIPLPTLFNATVVFHSNPRSRLEP
jgi:hypothetical protein